MVFYDKEACDFPIEPSFLVAQDENVSEILYEDFWAEYWDLNEVRLFVEVNVLGIHVIGGGKVQCCLACGVIAGNTKMMSSKSSPRIGMYGEAPFDRTQQLCLSRQFLDIQGPELIITEKCQNRERKKNKDGRTRMGQLPRQSGGSHSFD